MALTKDKKNQIIALRAQGLSYAKIAEEAKVAKQTAVDVVGENWDEIATLRGIALEELYEAQRVNARGRLEQLSSIQTRLMEEIESRNLADLSTDKLITLYLNLSKTIKEEVTPPQIRTSSEQERDQYNRNMMSW